jgi:hypothetical protein
MESIQALRFGVLGFGVWDSRFGDRGLGFGFEDLGFDFFFGLGVWGVRFGVQGLGFEVCGLGLRIWGLMLVGFGV